MKSLVVRGVRASLLMSLLGLTVKGPGLGADGYTQLTARSRPNCLLWSYNGGAAAMEHNTVELRLAPSGGSVATTASARPPPRRRVSSSRATFKLGKWPGLARATGQALEA
eukprot:3046682-Rhodomonas_salina.2